MNVKMIPMKLFAYFLAYKLIKLVKYLRPFPKLINMGALHPDSVFKEDTMGD